MHGCRECEIDLCGACFERPRTKPATPLATATPRWSSGALSDFRAHFDPLAAVAASDWDVSALLRGTRLRLAEGSFAQAAPDMPLRLGTFSVHLRHATRAPRRPHRSTDTCTR